MHQHKNPRAHTHTHTHTQSGLQMVNDYRCNVIGFAIAPVISRIGQLPSVSHKSTLFSLACSAGPKQKLVCVKRCVHVGLCV